MAKRDKPSHTDEPRAGNTSRRASCELQGSKELRQYERRFTKEIRQEKS